MTDLEDSDIATSKFIEEFVQRHWDQHGTACYLSNLGFSLKNELPESAKVLEDGLHEYLRRNPVVKIVQHPNIYQKIGAVPLSVTVPDHVEEIFATKGKLVASKRNTSYKREFWDAFIKPIEETVRIVCICDNGEIEVFDGHYPEIKENCYKIFPGDITENLQGSPISDRVEATHQAINAWLKRHSLDRAPFMTSKSSSSQRSVGHVNDFLRFFRGLPDEDLSRISIPLDILVKLDSKK
mgnify:CR=1 FL=1